MAASWAKVFIVITCLVLIQGQRQQTGLRDSPRGSNREGDDRRGGGRGGGGGGGGGGVGGGNGGNGSGSTNAGPTRLTVIQLVLRQRCAYWIRLGYTQLPYYCYQVQGKQQATSEQLLTFYEDYKKTVSREDQQKDLDEVRRALGKNVVL